MEVDCSLDEFAQSLALNGYINDDSCFTDTDLPTMLCELDASSVLDSPGGFPDSPYSSEEISRVLEIAQLAGTPLIDSCLPTNTVCESSTTLAKSFCNIDFGISSSAVSCTQIPPRTRDPCITHVNLDTHHVHNGNNVSISLGHGLNTAHTELHLDRTTFADTVSLNLNLLTSKESSIINNACFPVDPNLSPDVESPTSSTSQNSLPFQTHYHCHTVPLVNRPPPAYPTAKREKLETNDQLEATSLPLSQKQKRKRKSKGYSKPSKARRKKTKLNNEESEAPKPTPNPKPKPKQKPKLKNQTVKPNIACEVKDNSIENLSAQSYSEDSGFESAEKDKNSDSESVIGSLNGVTVNASESQNGQEETKGLRRSSRSTRKVDSYNLRLSSLVKRVETERRQVEPKQPKSKVKPAPLSKYRRRTANARERDRMKEINEAFEDLKACLPNVESQEPKQKVTKFTILSVALNYISNLREMLGYSNELRSVEGDFEMSSDVSSVRPASVTSTSDDSYSCSSPPTVSRQDSGGRELPNP